MTIIPNAGIVLPIQVRGLGVITHDPQQYCKTEKLYSIKNFTVQLNITTW